jgi:hypothetical protein
MTMHGQVSAHRNLEPSAVILESAVVIRAFCAGE